MEPVQALLRRALDRLPERYRWTLHNLVGHPVSEVLFQAHATLGSARLERLSDIAHDWTVPSPGPRDRG